MVRSRSSISSATLILMGLSLPALSACADDASRKAAEAKTESVAAAVAAAEGDPAGAASSESGAQPVEITRIADSAPPDSAAPRPAGMTGTATTAMTTSGGDPTVAAELMKGDFRTLAGGVKVLDLVVGTGEELKPGMRAQIAFDAWLADGTKYDSSAQRGGPMMYPYGSEMGIPFLNEGLAGMKKGGKRRIIAPPEKAYGASGRPPVIPPNATLIFEAELVDFKQGPTPMTFPDKAKLALQTTSSGLKWADIQVGKGTEVKAGGNVTVHYTGWLDDGTKFDSSIDHDRPFPIENVGKGQVIAGWNEGLQGMKEGGTRVLVIPPALAYGETGYPPVIPANSTLVFQVQAISVEAALPPPEAMSFPDIAATKLTTTPSGLKWADLKKGSGTELKAGGNARLHYSGWLENGTKFDSSLDRGTPIMMRNIGQAGMIKGWNEGVQGMKVGGRRLLVIPHELAYGASGRPPVIPPAATLVFVIDAVAIID